MPLNVIEANYYKTHTKGDAADEAQLAEILARYNLDDKSFGGICKGWWNWITKFFSGDLGRTLTNNRDVGEVIFENMGVSFAVSLISLVLELIIAIPLGIKCACNQYGKLDYTVTVCKYYNKNICGWFGLVPYKRIKYPDGELYGYNEYFGYGVAYDSAYIRAYYTLNRFDDEIYQNEYAWST